MNKKYLLVALSFLLVVSLLYSQKYVKRLLNSPVIDWSVQNSESKLLPLLINEGGFSGEWKWDLIVTYQNDQPIFDSNLDEYATRKLVGVYEKHDVRITDSLFRYYDDISFSDNNNDPNLDSVGVTSIKEVFSLSGDDFPNSKGPTCYVGEDNYKNILTRCVIVVINNNLSERIDIDIYRSASKDSVEKIVLDVQHLIVR
jgi:hypothetical protein